MTKTRLEAFSDGVIAIIITIMVLELRPPHGTDWAAIRPLASAFLSYVLSFIMLSIYWGNHHHLLHTLSQVNSKIIWANLHLLFWLSLVPFCTAWMGDDHFSQVTTMAYASLLVLCGLAYYILLRAIEGSHPHDTRLWASLEKQSRKGKLSVAAYVVAIPAALLHPVISGVIFGLVALFWWIPDRDIEQSLKDKRPAE
jgi:uncharacterized membrane protein